MRFRPSLPILTGAAQAIITYRFLRAGCEAKSHFAKPELNRRIVALNAHPFFFRFCSGLIEALPSNITSW